jgi:hypothetical protein
MKDLAIKFFEGEPNEKIDKELIEKLRPKEFKKLSKKNNMDNS